MPGYEVKCVTLADCLSEWTSVCPTFTEHILALILLIASGSCALSLDKKCLLLLHMDGTANLYRVGQSRHIQSYYTAPDDLNNYPVNAIFLPGDRTVACGSHSGDVYVWDISSGDHEETLSHGGKLLPQFWIRQRLICARWADGFIQTLAVSLVTTIPFGFLNWCFCLTRHVDPMSMFI